MCIVQYLRDKMQVWTQNTGFWVKRSGHRWWPHRFRGRTSMMGTTEASLLLLVLFLNERCCLCSWAYESLFCLLAEWRVPHLYPVLHQLPKVWLGKGWSSPPFVLFQVIRCSVRHCMPGTVLKTRGNTKMQRTVCEDLRYCLVPFGLGGSMELERGKIMSEGE